MGGQWVELPVVALGSHARLIKPPIVYVPGLLREITVQHPGPDHAGHFSSPVLISTGHCKLC